MEYDIEKMTLAWHTARTAVMLDDKLRFFGGIIMAGKLALDTSIPTASIDQYGVISVNPNMFMNLSKTEQKFVLCHEIAHPAFGYFARVEGKQYPDIFNAAHDVWINALLERDGLQLPDWVLTARKLIRDGYPLSENVLEDMTTEEIYDILVNHSQQSSKSIPQGQMSNDAQKSDDGQGSGMGDEDDGQDGKGSRVPVGFKPEELEDVNWDTLTLQAAYNAQPGYLPGSERMRLGIEPPKVDWRSALYMFFTSVTEEHHYTFKPPRRRFQWMGTTLPSSRPEHHPKLWFGLDVSGSMAPFLDHLIGEAMACQAHTKSVIRLLAGDTKLTHDEEVMPGDPWPAEITGWGGTYFTWLFEKFYEDAESNVTGIVMVTDGENFDTIPKKFYPDKPTLWIVFNNPSFVPQFGEVIHVSLKDL